MHYILSHCVHIQILRKYATEWIVKIDDITDFVKEQKKVLDTKGTEELLVAKETVYPVANQNIAQRIQLDFDEAGDQAKPTVVRGFKSQGNAPDSQDVQDVSTSNAGAAAAVTHTDEQT